MTDQTPSRNLRFEVAFATTPDDPAPAWVDLSSRVHLPSGISVSRGRQNEFDIPQTGRMTITLENTDGALSPDNASSPYYPNVLPQRRCRLTHHEPGNMIPAGYGDLESGIAWPGVGGATVASTTAKADQGTRSNLITFPTASANAAGPRITVTGFMVGRQYTGRARVWVPVGSPDVWLRIIGVSSATATSVKGAWVDVAVTFTATAASHDIYIASSVATTAGQQAYFDTVMLDEAPDAATLGPFTTTPAVVTSIFDGHVDEWPIEWPDGGDNYARAQITALDLTSRIGGRQKLRSVVVETLALDAPLLHFPLGEASGSTSVASIAGSAAVLDFGSGTGVPTDGAGSPVWASPSLTNGLYLTGPVGRVNTETGRWVGTGLTLVAAIASTSTLGEPVVTLSDRKGNKVQLGYQPDPDGRPFASFTPWNANFGLGGGGGAAVVGGTKTNNGSTHIIAVTVTYDGVGAGTITFRLYVDGVLVDTSSSFKSSIGQLDTLTIGGEPGVSAFYAGTVSHVAAWGSVLTAAQILEHYKSMSSGFAGERSDQRIARVCKWIGLPTSRQNFDVGISTSIGHLNVDGLDPLDYMRKIETTEAGLLFAGTDGRLTFYNRARSYTTAARTNLLSNPSFESSTSGWLSGGGRMTLSSIADGTAPDGAKIMRAVANVAAGGSTAYVYTSTSASPGDVHSGAISIRPDVSGSYLVRISYADASAVTLVTRDTGAVSLTGGSWTRLTVDAAGPAPAGTAFVYVLVYRIAAVVIGDTFDVDAALLENAPTAGPFITGTVHADVPALTVPSSMLDESARLVKNLELVVNDVSGSRPNGATVRMFDQDSVDAYGPLADDLELVTTSDDDVAAAVGWRFNTARTPRTRFTNLALDAATDPTYSGQIRSTVDIGVRVQLTDLPAQAPASTDAQVVQGYTATINDSTWDLAINASPYAHLLALVLDDPTYGALDSYPLAY